MNAIAISPDGCRVVCVDLHNDHRIHLFDASSGSCLWSDNGDTAKIFDVAFTKCGGKYDFVTAGSKHVKFWYAGEQKCDKGLYD